MLSIEKAIIATIIAAAVTFFTRVTPFLFFSKKQPGPLMAYVQRYIPPMTMVILVIYCLREIDWAMYPHGLPALAGVLLTFVLHLWLKNSLISIFGATAFYMFLIRVM